MSKFSFTGHASGTGTVSINIPNTNSDRTITMSDAGGNVVVSDGSLVNVIHGRNQTTITGTLDFLNASKVALEKWNIVGSDQTLSVGQNYFANTRAQANLQLTLPASANIGDTIVVKDIEGFASSNNVVVLRNSHNIDGVARNAVLTIDYSGIQFVYESSRNGWVTVKDLPKDVVGFQGSVSGYTAGGSGPGVNFSDIEKYPFAADSVSSTIIGDLTVIRRGVGSQSSNEHGYAASGRGDIDYDVIDKFPFAVDTNATDVGDTTNGKREGTGQSSRVNGYLTGGFYTPPTTRVDKIEKFPFTTDNNATDIGNLTDGRSSLTGQSSDTNGYSSGGFSPPNVNTIDKFPFAVDTNASDVGDMTLGRSQVQGTSSREFGYTSGALIDPTNRSDVIDKFPFASDTNATDVGDMTVGKSNAGGLGVSSTTDGYVNGGAEGSPGASLGTIERFPFASDTNATDVGNLNNVVQGAGGNQV